jgi:hypothetical protein
MNGLIRKITLGKDYKDGMHYFVGQNISNKYLINAILESEDSFIIWVENTDKELLMWKKVNKPYSVVVEYNLEF